MHVPLETSRALYGLRQMIGHKIPVVPDAKALLSDRELFSCQVLASERVLETTRRRPQFNCPIGDVDMPFVLCCRNLFDTYYREEVESRIARRFIEEGIR